MFDQIDSLPTFPLIFSNIHILNQNQGTMNLKWLNKDLIKGEHFVWTDPHRKTEFSIVKRSDTLAGSFNCDGSLLLTLHFKNGSYKLCLSHVPEPAHDNETILVPELIASRYLPFDVTKFMFTDGDDLFVSHTHVFMTLSSVSGSRLLLAYDSELNHLYNTPTTPQGLMVKIVHVTKYFVYLVTCDVASVRSHRLEDNKNTLETVVRFYYQPTKKDSFARCWNNWETVLYGRHTFDIQVDNGLFYFFTYKRVGIDRGQEILKLIHIDAERCPKGRNSYKNYHYQVPRNCYVTVRTRFSITDGVCSSADLNQCFPLVCLTFSSRSKKSFVQPIQPTNQTIKPAKLVEQSSSIKKCSPSEDGELEDDNVFDMDDDNESESKYESEYEEIDETTNKTTNKNENN